MSENNVVLNAAHIGFDYQDIVTRLSRILSLENPVRPVAIIFGRPHCKVIKDDISPNLGEYHLRSSDFLEIFCVGFIGGDEEFRPVDSFDAHAFLRATDSFEDRSKWRYSGETDLLLLNAYWHPQRKSAVLDFTTVVCVTLERALDRGVIQSVPAFIHDLLMYAKVYKGENLPFDYSDKMAIRNLGSILRHIFFAILPPPLKDIAKDAWDPIEKCTSWAIKDFTTSELEELARNSGQKELRVIEEFMNQETKERFIKAQLALEEARLNEGIGF